MSMHKFDGPDVIVRLTKAMEGQCLRAVGIITSPDMQAHGYILSYLIGQFCIAPGGRIPELKLSPECVGMIFEIPFALPIALKVQAAPGQILQLLIVSQLLLNDKMAPAQRF